MGVAFTAHVTTAAPLDRSFVFTRRIPASCHHLTWTGSGYRRANSEMLRWRKRPVRYQAGETVHPTAGMTARVYACQPARAHGSGGAGDSIQAITPPGPTVPTS